jgi:hypothetical protein
LFIVHDKIIVLIGT